MGKRHGQSLAAANTKTSRPMEKLTRRQFLARSLAAGAAVAGAGVLAGPLAGCSARRRRGEVRYGRVIVLGFDGFDPRLVERWMKAGRLPGFAAVAAQGGFAKLAAALPAMSPVAWSNMATGCNPGQHGLFDYIRRDPRTYLPQMAHRRSKETLGGTRYLSPRHRDGYWRFVSEAGVPATVIRYPVTFPAESVRGRMLSGLGTPDLLGREGEPTLYTTSGRELRTRIQGPATGKDRRVSVPLSITLHNSDSARVVAADGPAVTATQGQWTRWVPLRFRVGPRVIHGNVKFLLVQARPQLKVYMTPINIDPVAQTYPITYPPRRPSRCCAAGMGSTRFCNRWRRSTASAWPCSTTSSSASATAS